jgi:hypothetical protein
MTSGGLTTCRGFKFSLFEKTGCWSSAAKTSCGECSTDTHDCDLCCRAVALSKSARQQATSQHTQIEILGEDPPKIIARKKGDHTVLEMGNKELGNL